MKPKTLKKILKQANQLYIKQRKQPDMLITLTDDDKFALAMCAGVRLNFKYRQEKDKYIVDVNTEICGVAWDGRGFQVFTKGLK